MLLRKKSQRNTFFFISSLTNSGLEKNGERYPSLSTAQGWDGNRVGRARARPPCLEPFYSSYFGLRPSGLSCPTNSGECVRMGIARRSDRRRAARRLFLSRTHFSAEKTRGARAQTVGMFLWTSQATGAGRVLLVGAASLPRARVRPTPQETVATLKFSTKKLVVAHPRLEEVFPLFRETRFKLELFFSQAQGESHAIVTTRPKLELMLKYFNENISQALQERYRDLHEYRKTEAVEEGSPREAKIPKIAEEGENLGGGGAFENAAPPFARLLEQPKEEDSFVASWLHNSFKMTAAEGNHPPNNTETPGGSALDLRAAPLSLHIPALQQAEAQRQFKMEFWNRSRPGSPETHDQLGPPPTPQPPATPDHKTMTEKLVNEIQVSLLNFLENL